MKQRTLVSAIAAELFLFSAIDLHACACCADPGEYRQTSSQSVDQYEETQLNGMEFADMAQLFLTDAGDEEVKGISSVSAKYALTVAADPKRWRLTLRAEAGEMGEIILTRPAKMAKFSADIHDGEANRAGGPILYKEWRFEGRPTGGGIFAPGFAAPARYLLIFQGRGNRCDNAEDFTHWRLEISGAKATYALFGKLSSARAVAPDEE